MGPLGRIWPLGRLVPLGDLLPLGELMPLGEVILSDLMYLGVAPLSRKILIVKGPLLPWLVKVDSMVRSRVSAIRGGRRRVINGDCEVAYLRVHFVKELCPPGVHRVHGSRGEGVLLVQRAPVEKGQVMIVAITIGCVKWGWPSFISK